MIALCGGSGKIYVKMIETSNPSDIGWGLYFLH